MNKIPGLKADVGFGGAETKLPNWRKAIQANEQDPDDEEIETPEDVKAILGFDPVEDDDESEDDMMRETLVNRMAQNRCKDRAGLPEGAVENATMLEQASPSPMIGKYAKGSKQAVKNGTSLWARFPGKSNEQITAEIGKEVLAKRIARRLSKPAKPMPKPKSTAAPVMNSHGEDEELEAGIKVEMEHGGNRKLAEKIARDHLREDPRYYSKLKGCGMAKE